MEVTNKTNNEKAVEVKAKIESAKTELATAKENMEVAEKELNKALKENGFDSKDEANKNLLSTDKMDSLQREISEYDAEVVSNANAIDAILKELKGKKETDLEEVERQLGELETVKNDYISKQSKIETEKKRLEIKYDNLMSIGKNIEKDIVEADNDLSFAKALRGDTGIGLQRYVLGIMFSSVVSAANKMLELVHGGRYRFFRTEYLPSL